MFLSAIGLFLGTAFVALFLRKAQSTASFLGGAGAFIGSVTGFIGVIRALQGDESQTLRLGMSLPGAAFYLKIDPLSGFFLIVLFGLSAVVSLYGQEYLEDQLGKKAVNIHWSFFNGFLASMSIALAAHNAILFLIAWETMSVLSLFLVTFEHERFVVRRAGFIYFVATNLGTACLLVCFILLGRIESVLDYENLSATAEIASWAFLVGLAGFGLKAGIIPLHVWLPEAHPAAPSHVSALMSGVMIKLGIYGILRLLQVLGHTGQPMPIWWGVLLVAFGAASGILGVLFALGQHDLKRLLAYHSVENIGIIVMGMGIGLLGIGYHYPIVTALGFAGALLHVLNHALFKGLLFLGAGTVAHSTGTRDMEQLGGLAKKMPLTATTFLVGSAAICGLPPLNGFISELLIYASAFFGAISWRHGHELGASIVLASLATVLALALIGGLAIACFTKVFGIVFLGEPRTQVSSKAHDPGWKMLFPMLALALGCIAVGFTAFLFLPALSSVVAQVSGLPTTIVRHQLVRFSSLPKMASLGGLVLISLAVFIASLRKALLARRTIRRSITWDCGYIDPTARMQYSASSFAQPIVDFFALILRPQKREVRFSKPFPRPVAFHSEVADVFAEKLYNPFAAALRKIIEAIRDVQPANVHFFAGYIIFTLVLLIIWNYFFGATL